MRKLIIILSTLIVLGVIGFFGYRAIQNRRRASAITNLETVPAARGSLTSTVGATGVVRANQTAMLAWETTGNVDQVLVGVGEKVSTGQILSNLLTSSLPQNIILAQSDLISAKKSLSQLTTPDLSTISTAEKSLAAAYASYQQAQTNLSTAIITNKNSNKINLYNDWFNAKTALDTARNDVPLVNSPIEVQAYYQAVRQTALLQESLTIAQNSASLHPGDFSMTRKVSDLQAAVQDSQTKQNNLQAAIPADMVGHINTLSDKLSAYEKSTQDFIGTVITDTTTANVDLASIQADLAQKQSTLITTQKSLTDLVNKRKNMNGVRCDQATISDYQKAYDNALNAYNFSGHIANSKEYQALQTASANLSWCTAVWSAADIAEQDAKISSTQAQIQLLQAQIIADQTQIADATNSVFGLAIQLNTTWAAYQDADQILNNAVTTLYELQRSPNPDDVASAEARLQAAQKAVDSQSLTAPFDGTITEVDSKPGDQVAPGTIAFRLDNLDHILVDVQVSEVDINSIQVGQQVALTFDAITNKAYKGLITQVAPVGNVVQGVVQFNVTVELIDADQDVKPGMTAAVTITVDQLSDVLLVPNRAVRVINGQRVVFILKDGKLQEVKVTLGASSDTESQVLSSDLQVDDQIVLNPPQDIFGGSGGGGFFGGR